MEAAFPSTRQLVDFKSGDDDVEEAKFFDDELRRTLCECMDTPVMVVSVTGVFRSGKSFLLNLMVTYLRHLSKTVSIVPYLELLPF